MQESEPLELEILCDEELLDDDREEEEEDEEEEEEEDEELDDEEEDLLLLLARLRFSLPLLLDRLLLFVLDSLLSVAFTFADMFMMCRILPTTTKTQKLA